MPLPFGQFATCRARIEVDRPKDVYTNNDVITGTLYVTLTREMSIKDITISLVCQEEILMSRRQNNMARSNFLQFTHFDERVIVFPPPELTQGGDVPNTVFTLQSGEYEYPFTLLFPSNAGLPESFEFDSDTMIQWNVKAHVARAGLLNPDIRAKWTLHFVPNRAALYQSMVHQLRTDCANRNFPFKAHDINFKPSLRSKFSSKNRINSEVVLEMSVPRLGLLQAPYDAGIELSMVPSVPGVVVLQKLRITLECVDIAGDEMLPRACVTRYDLTRLEDLDITLTDRLSLSDVLSLAGQGRKLLVEDSIVGSFCAKFLARQISLLVTLVFASTYYLRHTSTRRASYQVNLAPRSLPETVRAIRTARTRTGRRSQQPEDEEPLPRYEVSKPVSVALPPPYVAR